MLLKTIVAMLAFSFVSMAQPGTPTTTTGTVTAPAKKEGPKIADDVRAKFWRAQSDSLAAQAQFQKARVALETVIEQMKTTCGTDFELNGDPQGEPLCVEKKVAAPERRLGPPTENTPPAPPAAPPK